MRKFFDHERIRYEASLPYLADVRDQVIAVDTETSGLHPDDGARISCVSLAWRDTRDRYIHSWVGFWGQGSGDQITDAGSDLFKKTLHLLSKCHLVMHNAKFDLHMLRAGTKTGVKGLDLVDSLLVDTMVWSHLVRPLQSAALKPTAVDIWGEDADAEKQALQPYLGTKTDPRFDRVPPTVILPYAAMDTVYTLKLYELFSRWMDEGINPASDLSFEMALLKDLYRMEIAGIPYDPKVSRRCADILNSRCASLSASFPVDPKDAKKWYFGSKPFKSRGRVVEPLRLEPLEVTPSGAPSMTKQVLGLMCKDVDRFPQADVLDQINFFKRASSIWYTPYADRCGADNRIRGSIRQVASGYGAVGGTVSGRYSIERINLQALPHDSKLRDRLQDVPTPRDIIRQEVARLEGYTIVEADLAQAELRVAALNAGCETMLKAIRNGDDLHGMTARSLFKVSPEDPTWSKFRQIAKRANFSLIFGAGARAFSQMIFNETGERIPFTEANDIVRGWRALYPQFTQALEYWEAYADSHGYVPISDYRRRWFKKGEYTSKAFNQVVQASLAQLAKRWLRATSDYMHDLGYHKPLDIPYTYCDNTGRTRHTTVQAYAGLLMVVHDSQMLLLPQDRVQEIGSHVASLAVQAWDTLFPGVPGGVDFKAWDLD